MKTNIKRDNSLRIYDWMRSDLCLSGSELFTYAVVYDLADKDGWFYGSRQVAADWIGCDKQTVSRALSGLVGKGLVEKRVRVGSDNVSHNEYRATFDGKEQSKEKDMEVEEKYAIKARDPLLDNQLSLESKALLAILTDLGNSKDVTMNDLCETVIEDKKTVWLALGELYEHGYIRFVNESDAIEAR